VLSIADNIFSVESSWKEVGLPVVPRKIGFLVSRGGFWRAHHVYYNGGWQIGAMTAPDGAQNFRQLPHFGLEGASFVEFSI
jgi:hypothetical protein